MHIDGTQIVRSGRVASGRRLLTSLNGTHTLRIEGNGAVSAHGDIEARSA